MGKYRFPILEYARFETIKAGLVKSNVTSETRIVIGSRIDQRSGNDRIDAIRASIDRSIDTLSFFFRGRRNTRALY